MSIFKIVNIIVRKKNPLNDQYIVNTMLRILNIDNNIDRFNTPLWIIRAKLREVKFSINWL